MKKFFTISEFGQLRNININSLRYYEKIGLLKPAHIDPETKYRYYTPEQLSELDTIQLCIALGIPLKELMNYVDENGYLQNRILLEDGKAAAEKKIKEIENGLKKIEYSLRYIEDTHTYEKLRDVYTRTIPVERRLITRKYVGALSDDKSMEQMSSALYTYAQSHDLLPVLPSGLLMQYGEQQIDFYLYFEIVDKFADDPNIITMPAGEYRCMQVDGELNEEMVAFINKQFGCSGGQQVIVSNMVLDRFQFGSKKSEIQIIANME